MEIYNILKANEILKHKAKHNRDTNMGYIWCKRTYKTT